MSQKRKVINVKSSVVIKKSPEFKDITHKASAGLSEAEAIERHTIGNFGDDKREEEQEQEQSNL